MLNLTQANRHRAGRRRSQENVLPDLGIVGYRHWCRGYNNLNVRYRRWVISQLHLDPILSLPRPLHIQSSSRNSIAETPRRFHLECRPMAHVDIGSYKSVWPMHQPILTALPNTTIHYCRIFYRLNKHPFN